MRTKLLLLLFLSVSIFALGLARAQEAQDPNEEEEGARGTFLKSRENKATVPTSGNSGGGSSGIGTIGGPTSAARPAGAARPRPTPKPTPRPTPKTMSAKNNTKKPLPPTSKGGNSGGQTASVKPPTNNTGGGNPSMVKVKLDPSSVGLGYSLFQRGAGDEPIRVDPANSFRTGDAVRIWLEPSADGYLYIFNTTNNGIAHFVYPDMRIGGGDNRVKAHRPFELPGADNPDPRFRWFAFYGQAGTEQLYILLTKEPIKGLPASPAELKAYCSQNTKGDECVVQESVWAQVKSFDQQDKVYVAKNTAEVGQKQAKAERPSEVASRGFGLVPTEPAPTVVFMNASADRSVLFAKLELKHN
jgi:hypothetical protein